MNAPCPPRGTAGPQDPRRVLAGTARSATLDEGGETACWAHLVCDVCGAISCRDHGPDPDRSRAEPNGWDQVKKPS